MIERVREIFRNYNPRTAVIRVGIVALAAVILGTMNLIMDGFATDGIGIAIMLGGIIYGFKIFFNLGSFYQPNYHRGYWSDGSADGAVLEMAGALGVRAAIAFSCGLFLMAVEFIQTIVFCIRKFKQNKSEQAS